MGASSSCMCVHSCVIWCVFVFFLYYVLATNSSKRCDYTYGKRKKNMMFSFSECIWNMEQIWLANVEIYNSIKKFSWFWGLKIIVRVLCIYAFTLFRECWQQFSLWRFFVYSVIVHLSGHKVNQLKCMHPTIVRSTSCSLLMRQFSLCWSCRNVWADNQQRHSPTNISIL